MAGILLAKVLEGRLAFFVRSEGEVFIVSVDGEEREVSREVWKMLPEQEVQEKDRVYHFHHRPKRR